MQVAAQKIVVLGTGGTIAGTAGDASDNIGYTAGQVGVQQLLEAIPGLAKAAGGGELVTEQIAQVDSKDMEHAIWQRLSERCAVHLADPEVRGIVITHGTDTLEETAWFLRLVLDARKPVVLTCAMRPATALSPDGPQNLLDAMAVATAEGAHGVVAVAAGTVHGAEQVRKVHPYRVDAFDSGESGPLGWVEEGQVRLARDWPAAEPLYPQLPWSRAGEATPATSASAVDWPRVDIVLSHAAASGRVVDLLAADGVDGLVVTATGNGTVHAALEAALLRAQMAGVAVRVASRCPLGRVLPRPGDALQAETQGLGAVKTRVSLMLHLLAARHRR